MIASGAPLDFPLAAVTLSRLAAWAVSALGNRGVPLPMTGRNPGAFKAHRRLRAVNGGSNEQEA
ncbi:hypothetical protein [Streptomyces glycanivorans]|uniref:Uncharacterized protein n=1 Tax=Streptomyces glycanivorans TaxID=3033808 RepID=A0ABY9JNW0_9ACTN|nr:hypothetical protein [Streptomyces sp. Alt3]WLQ69393.1 hypothetical protein P8A20_38445 [Streptomyces sp. Alt3]